MAYKRVSCESASYEFILDTDNDANDLPAGCCCGSTALSCESGSVFIVNASGEWVKLGG